MLIFFGERQEEKGKANEDIQDKSKKDKEQSQKENTQI